MQVKCIVCGTEFYGKPSHIKKGSCKFCSRRCYAEFQKTDGRKRFSLKKYRKEHFEEIEKKRLKSICRPLSDEHRQKIREASLRNGNIPPIGCGENHSNWKGGGWLYWRKQALIRDDYTCVKCGFSKKEIMVVDHILPRKTHNHLLSELSNMQTLCPNCHAIKTLSQAKITNTHKNCSSKISSN